MTEEKKMELFNRMLYLEHMSEKTVYNHRNYWEMANGAFEMIEILGLASEYVRWSERR